MLTLTENASTVVKTIVEQSGPAEAGLRISQDAVDSPALHVMATEAPQPGDQVLEETAAETLDDMVLDARVDDNGGVEFSITAQA